MQPTLIPRTRRAVAVGAHILALDAARLSDLLTLCHARPSRHV